ncbi:MAG TPA: VOC family protein, partial [Rhizomicrobium sp.]
MPSQFFWHELMTTDTKAAEKFYGDVVGWRATDSGVPGETPYTLFNVGDRGIAGMLKITPDMAQNGARPGWLGCVSVDNVDEALSRLKQEGGKAFMGPQEVPNVIRFAMVADPQGAPFYIAKGLMEAPPPLPMGTPGTVGWNELMASD